MFFKFTKIQNIISCLLIYIAKHNGIYLIINIEP